jgi:hypothetical protein
MAIKYEVYQNRTSSAFHPMFLPLPAGSGRLNIQCRSDISLHLNLHWISRHLGTKPQFERSPAMPEGIPLIKMQNEGILTIY